VKTDVDGNVVNIRHASLLRVIYIWWVLITMVF